MTLKPLSDLQLPGFPMYTRDSYFKTFGKAAPPADPTKRPKAWIGTGSYLFLQGLATLVQDSVPGNENDVNIEGAGPFTAYVLQPTKASTAGPGGQPYNPLYLSLEADARALMAAIGGKNLRDEGANAFLPISYPADELRREWEFDSPGGIGLNAGSLLYARNMAGVGSPGHWNTVTPVPSWVPQLHPVPKDLNNPWGPPCRALAPNESIGPGMLGVPQLIVDDGTPAQPGQSGSDHDLLARAVVLMQALADRFGITV